MGRTFAEGANAARLGSSVSACHGLPCLGPAGPAAAWILRDSDIRLLLLVTVRGALITASALKQVRHSEQERKWDAVCVHMSL